MDTGQPIGAPENVALQAAADAFKAFTSPPPAPVARDESGRFAPAQAEAEPVEEIEAAAEPADAGEEAAESHEEGAEQVEAADEAQPEPTPLPTSWPEDKAELWKALPPETQAVIAEREGQRDAAVNAKFQEAANVRKSFETAATKANATIEHHSAAIDQVLALIQPQPPSVNDYIDADGNFHRAQYDLAEVQYKQTLEAVNALNTQRDEIIAQREREADTAAQEALKQAWERDGERLLTDIPDLRDPVKGAVIHKELQQHAVARGINPAVLQQADPGEVLVLWESMQFRKQQEAKAKVQPKVAPKPAAPAVRPGVTTPASAVRKSNESKLFDRLAKTGSVEDGAAIWKLALSKGR